MAPVADSVSESEPPATLAVPGPSSLLSPTSSVVQEPVLVIEPASSTSPLTTSDADDGAAPVSTSVVVVENSTSAGIVRTPERAARPHEAVIGVGRPSGALSLLELKQRRAREREERRRQLGGRSPDSNRSVLTNGTVTNGVDSPSPRHIADSTSYVAAHHRYSNRYDIAAPDKKDQCCVVM